MASYTYKCQNEDCKYEFTITQGMNNTHEVDCPKCGNATKQIFSATSSIWKCKGDFGKSK